MNDYEFHRRRAELEIDAALCAVDDAIASHHLALARLHHRKTRETGPRVANGSAPIFWTDKEA